MFLVVFEGELAYSSEPYVYLNMPELDDSHFHQIGRPTPNKKTELKPSNKAVRTLLSSSAAVPAGIAGGLGVAVLGLVGVSLICPLAAPAVIAVGILAPGAIFGTATAMGTGSGVEKLYDDRHQKE